MKQCVKTMRRFAQGGIIGQLATLDKNIATGNAVENSTLTMAEKAALGMGTTSADASALRASTGAMQTLRDGIVAQLPENTGSPWVGSGVFPAARTNGLADRWPAANPSAGIAGFANGGAVETAEQLMARMAAKYGTTAAASAPDPTPAPVRAQAITQEPQQRGIINLLKNRGAQIDKAVNGYANGGKIVGPGTSTSDSIPGEVVETKEPIKVSTKERIVSKDQDVFLEGIAAGLGYRDLNALLEAGTGKPVGPTVKHGKAHAATGAPPGEKPWLKPFANAVGGVFDTVGNVAKAVTGYGDNVQSVISESNKDIDSVDSVGAKLHHAGKGALATLPAIAADVYSAVAPSVTPLITGKDANPATMQATRVQTPPVVQSGAQERTFGASGADSAGSPANSPPLPDASPAVSQQQANDYAAKIAEAQRGMQLPAGQSAIARGNAGLNAIARSPGVRDTLNAAHASIGDGISFGVTRGADGKPQTLISGTAPTQAQYISADGKPTSDWRETRDYADAQERNAKDRESASRMERERLERNTRDDITNPSVKAWALANLDRMNDDELLELKRQAYGQQAITAGLDQQTKRLALGQATDTEALRKKVISGDPVAAEQWKVLNNRDRQDVKIATEEVPNPDGTVTKIPYAVYGNQTSRRVSDMAGSNATPRFSTPAELEAAKRAGKIKAGDIVSTPNGNIRVK